MNTDGYEFDQDETDLNSFNFLEDVSDEDNILQQGDGSDDDSYEYDDDDSSDDSDVNGISQRLPKHTSKKRKLNSGEIEKFLENDESKREDKIKKLDTDGNDTSKLEYSKSGVNMDNIRESELFKEFRHIGLVCNDVPFAFQKLGDSFFIATCIGSSFQIYEGKKLRLKLAARSTSSKINAIAVTHDITLTAVGSNIELWQRLDKVGVITKHTGRVYILYLLGHWLLSVGTDKMLYVWNLKRLINRKVDLRKVLDRSTAISCLQTPVKSINFTGNGADSHVSYGKDYITSLTHPKTYHNKILIGFHSGRLELWNINSKQKIYVFKNHLPSFNSFGSFSKSNSSRGNTMQNYMKSLVSLNKKPISLDAPENGMESIKSDADAANDPKNSNWVPKDAPAITCVERSHDPNYAAIGYSNGKIVILDLVHDEQVTTFEHFNHRVHRSGRGNDLNQKNGQNHSRSKPNGSGPDDVILGSINSLSFRNDGVPHLCSVGTDGNIIVWNLQTLELQSVHYRAHNERIVKCLFLENEPVMVTSGCDNAIKMWIFDDNSSVLGGTGMCKLLKQRTGHECPPHLVKFHGRRTILSTANDGSLRVSWLNRDIQCVELGQAARKKEKKKLPRIRQLDSSNIKSRFWSNLVTCHNGDNRVRLWSTMKNKLDSKMLLPSGASSHASRANVSYVCISHCGNFAFVGRTSGVIDQFNLESGRHRARLLGHTNSIRSLHLNLFNNVLISTSADKSVKFWNISKASCKYTIADVGGVVSCAAYDAKSNILALATDDLDILVYDASNGNLIRRFDSTKYFNTHRAHITSILLNQGCHWLLVASMDGCVRVFDLASAVLVDWFKFDAAVTSMALAPNNAFLATTHVNEAGIVIWANKSHFGRVFLKPVQNEPLTMDSIQKASKKEVINPLQAAAAKLEEVLQSSGSSQKLVKTDKKEIDDEDLEMNDANESNESNEANEANEAKDGSDALDDEEEESEDWVYSSSEGSEDSDIVIEHDQGLDPSDALDAMDSDEEDLPDLEKLHLDVKEMRDDGGKLITKSKNAKSIWMRIANYDLIATRNRPSTKVTKDLKAPFFLPSLHTNPRRVELDISGTLDELKQQQFLQEVEQKKHDIERRKKLVENVGNDQERMAAEATVVTEEVKDLDDLNEMENIENVDIDNFESYKDVSDSRLVRILKKGMKKGNLHEMAVKKGCEYLMQLSAAMADAEMRLIGMNVETQKYEFEVVLKFFVKQVESNKNFETIQAYINLFLKLHCEPLLRYASLNPLVEKLKKVNGEKWGQINELFQSNLCLIEFFSNMQQN